MKDKKLPNSFLNNKTNNWSKDTWKILPVSQQPEYIDTELLNEITDKVLIISLLISIF